MSWGSVLMLAGAASADCLIIGFNYGVKGVRIGGVSNLFMASVCFLGTLLSVMAGRALNSALHPVWGEIAGGALLALLGLYMLRGALFPRPKAVRQHYSENPEIVDKDQSQVIELRESILIGFLLCVNNIGIGIGGGISGSPVLLTPLACSLLSFLFTAIGFQVGVRIENPRLSKIMEGASAVLVLLLGIKVLLSIQG